MSTEDVAIEVPLRDDGTPKSFWYDRDYPDHIMHRPEEGYVHTICVHH